MSLQAIVLRYPVLYSPLLLCDLAIGYVRALRCPLCEAAPEQACFNEVSGKFDLVKNHIERMYAYFDNVDEAVKNARAEWEEIYQDVVEEMRIEPESLEAYDWVLS